jgi:nitroimidazol reductase NimA-like FMN-containing flavoprotein (pyridoxamine 5'-phosphate oxidase superfamily)
MANSLRTTKATTVRRAERAQYDRPLAYAVLDGALVAHVAFVDDGQPFAIPMVFGRIDDTLYLHGAVGARVVRRLAAGTRVCVTVTHVDALVLAKAQVHHSANYRCVMLLGTMRRVTGTEAEQALAAIVDHALPGRSAEARPPDAGELRRTGVLALDIDEGSVKVRAHGPVDDETDLVLPVWSGLLPVAPVARAPIADESSEALPVPVSVLSTRARINGGRVDVDLDAQT